SEVTFAFTDKVDVRTFREDLNFVLDVGASDAPAAGFAAAAGASAAGGTPIGPGELAGLTLPPVPAAENNTAPAQRPAAVPRAERTARGKDGAPAPMAPGARKPAAGQPPPAATPPGAPRATAPPETPKAESPSIASPKPAAPPAGAVASKAPAADAFPPVQ